MSIDFEDTNNPHEFDPWGASVVEVVEALARDLDFLQHTAMVAKVESYDPTRGCCNATPCVNQVIGTKSVPYPVFTNIPVIFMGGGGRSSTWQLKRGDYVLIVFNMRSLDEWRRTGDGGRKGITARDKRRYDMNDGMAIAGPRPFTAPFLGQLDDAWRAGDDRYDDPEGEGPLGNFRVADDVIEVVLSDRTDAEGEPLPDRVVRIDKVTGKVVVGEAGEGERGVVITDDQVEVVDGDASVTVKPGEVVAQVGDVSSKVIATQVVATAGSASTTVEDGSVVAQVGLVRVEASASGGARLEVEANDTTTEMGIDSNGRMFLRFDGEDVLDKLRLLAGALKLETANLQPGSTAAAGALESLLSDAT